MAKYTVTFAGRAPRDPHRDVKGVNVRIHRDSEYVQYGYAVIDGLPLITEYGDDLTSAPEFWSDVARASVPLFEAAVRRGEIPFKPKTDGYEVRPQHVQPTGDSLEEGDVVGEFEV